MNDLVANKAVKPASLTDPYVDPIDLASYLDLLLDQRWLIIAVAVAITLLGSAYAFMATPIYEANILVQVEDNANPGQDVFGTLAGAFDLKSAATAEMEILRSRLVVGRAVANARLDLTVEPKYFPVLGRWIAKRRDSISEPGLLGLGGYVWGNERAQVAKFEIPSALRNEKFVLTALGEKKYKLNQADAHIELVGEVGQDCVKKTDLGTVEIRVDRLVGIPGAAFVIVKEQTLDTVAALQKALAIEERGKQSGIIGVSLEGKDPQKTANTLNEIGKEYLRQNVDRKSAEAEKSLAFLEQQLPIMKANLEKAEAKYNAFRNSRSTIDLDEEARSVLQQAVFSQGKLLELKQKRDELLTRYQESNPLVQAVAQQMRTLSADINSINKKIKAMPAIEQDVLRLTRDVKVSTDLYTSLLNSAQQLRLVKASKVGTVRLLDDAVAPLHPIRPKRTLVIFVSLVIGIFVGIVCALVRKSLFGGVAEPHEIEQMLGLTVIAAIPFSEKQVELYQRVQRKERVVSVLATCAPSDSAIESLRSFRTSLQFAMLGAKNNIIMITGPTPSVGKSFVSVNFAAVLASAGKKILLIDGDIRKGYLNSYFGVNRQCGLSELIAGELQLEQALHKEVVENVDFIAAGIFPPRPAEMLGHENFQRLLETVSASYDYVIMDTAPVLAVADAMVVAPYTGAIFNVVRGDISTIGEIHESVKRLNQAGNDVAGVVFNGLKPHVGRYGSKYGRYRYEQYKY